MRAATLPVLAALLFSFPASAHSHSHWRHVAVRQNGDSRPAAWCGWWLRHLFGIADRSLDVALNWAHWGRPSGPRPGAVVVWSHGHGRGHVGIIRSGPCGANRYVVESGNDGHAVRTRCRSIAGTVAVRI